MGASVLPDTPQDQFSDLTQLASRIATHLRANPNDAQAREDLRYVTGQMQGPTGAAAAANTADTTDASGLPTSNAPAAAASGLAQAALDVPRGIAQAVMHPLRTAGQLTGVGNWGNLVRTLQDPEADLAEKVGAAIQSTPLNMGYAPERALLDATGATADTPASVEDQFHRGGNVASLALLGLNRNTPGVRMVGRVMGKLPIVGPVSRAVGDVMQRYAKPAPEAGPPTQADMEADLGGGPNRAPSALPSSDAFRAVQDFSKGKITGTDLSDALDFARHGPSAFEPRGGAFQEPSSQPPPVVQPAALAGVPPATKAPIGSVPSTAAQAAPDALRGLTDEQLAAQPGGATPPLAASAAAPGAIEGQALAATRRAMTPPDGTPAPAEAAPVKQVAKSYADLQRLLKQGVPRDQIQVGYYTRGGAAEQSIAPAPHGTAAVSPPVSPELQALMDQSDAMGLRRARAAVSDPATQRIIDTELARRAAAASFSGGGMKGVAQALQHPAYQRASILAGRILDTPDLLAKYPQFAGQTAEQATATLRGMIVKQAEAGQAIPPITSLGKFLERLSAP